MDGWKLLLSLLLCAALCAGTAAASEAGEDLRALGLLSGTGGGRLELERAPTRAEALTLAVRLMGREARARTLYPDAPGGWAAPCAAYAAACGLADWTREELGEPAGAEEFLNLLLQALSCRPGRDFDPARPWALAREMGLWTGEAPAAFLRADMARLSAAALRAEIPEAGQSLAQRLIAQGMLDAQAWARYAQRLGVNTALEGAWEPNYLGPRVEIRGTTLRRLWRGQVVLESGFTLRREGARQVLDLETRELCYPGQTEPYAALKACWLEEGVLTLVDDFPITGESVETLRRTNRSRYGAGQTVTEEILPELQGRWSGEWLSLEIRGDVLTFDGQAPVEIAVLLENGDLTLRPRSAGHSLPLLPLRYHGASLSGEFPVLDARAEEFVLTRER